jgi:hypothetical protein
METKIYSKHTITDGKWEIVLHVLEEPDRLEILDLRQNMRVLLDKLYSSDAVSIAKTMLNELMSATRVEVRPLYGPIIIGTKEEHGRA